MVVLWIDGRRCDIDNVPMIPVDFDADNLTNVEGARDGREIELFLPKTPANNALFGASRDIFASESFNMKHHIAKLEQNGVIIFEGTAYLHSTIIGNGLKEGYKVLLREGGAGWIKSLISNDISNLDISFSAPLNLSTISSSWEGEQAVRFLPIYRGDCSLKYSASTMPVERVMLTDDYHPFVSVTQMINAMFDKTGYRLKSRFLEGEFAKSLYVSGDYSHSDASEAQRACDFFARRAKSATTTADYLGRVYASSAFAAHSVGAIVDTANPEAVDSNGIAMRDTFCNNNSFAINGAGNICFTPSRSVKAGFILHLEYLSDYKILSRSRLRGFDTVEGLNGLRVKTILANTFKDYRNEAKANRIYRVVVFDHVENREYQLIEYPTSGGQYVMGEWSSRSTLIGTSASGEVKSLSLYYRDSSSAAWRVFDKDWALYDGYVEEEGTTEVVMDIRIPPQDVAAGESLVLDKFWFAGAEAGMSLTLHTATSLRPYFTNVPGYGSVINYKDIAPKNIRQIEMLSAVGKMFNLAYYTDEVRKEVYIEPLEDIYDEGDIFDIDAKVNLLSGFTLSDAGWNKPQDFLLTYLNGDAASHRFNTEEETVLGEWLFRNPLYGTKDSVETVRNPLFATTLNISGVVYSAPSASILQVGDIGSVDSGFDAPFATKIVSYKGLKKLPDGEVWPATNELNVYPYAAFIDEEVNLCYETRNGLVGLHRFYLPMLHRRTKRQRVTTEIYFSTAEMAKLFTADGPKLSFRSKFRFKIEGESALFRLVKIVGCNCEEGVVRCTFERELED